MEELTGISQSSSTRICRFLLEDSPKVPITLKRFTKEHLRFGTMEQRKALSQEYHPEVLGEATLILDGTDVPCWTHRSRGEHASNYRSKKNGKSALRIQAACLPNGRWLPPSTPTGAKRHDSRHLRESRWIEIHLEKGNLTRSDCMATDGSYGREYSGVKVLRPPRRSQGSYRSREDRRLSEAFSRYRGLIERRFGTLKNSCHILKNYRLNHAWFFIIFSFCQSMDNLNQYGERHRDFNLYQNEEAEITHFWEQLLSLHVVESSSTDESSRSDDEQSDEEMTEEMSEEMEEMEAMDEEAMDEEAMVEEAMDEEAMDEEAIEEEAIQEEAIQEEAMEEEVMEEDDSWLGVSLQNRLCTNEVVESDQEESESSRIEQTSGQEDCGSGSTSTQVWTELELNKLKLVDIKGLCREFGLGVSANKAALVRRILLFQGSL